MIKKVRVLGITFLLIIGNILIFPTSSKNVVAYQDDDGGYFSNNTEWDAGTKSESNGNREVITSSDSIYGSYGCPANGTLELENLYSDKFDITDADGLTAKWQDGVWLPSTTYICDINDTHADKMYQETPGTNTTDALARESKASFSGDFNVSVNLDCLSFSTQRSYASFFIYTDSSNYCFIERGNRDSQHIRASTVVSGESTNSQVNTADNSVSFRIARTGQTICLYYDLAGGDDWTLLHSNATYSTGVFVPLLRLATTTTPHSEQIVWSNYTMMDCTPISGTYRTAGNWTSPLIPGISNKYMNSITANLSFADANNCIDKIEILNGIGTVLTTANTNITASTTLTSSDFDNGLNVTNGIDTKIKVYLVGNGTATPTLTNISYTLSANESVQNRAYVTSYYATEGSIEGFINSTRYDDNIFGYINESQENHEYGYGTDKEWGYWAQDTTWENSTATTWAAAEDFNVSFGGQSNRSGLYLVFWSVEMSGLNSAITSNFQTRFRINNTVYHNYSIKKDETYTWPIFSGFTIFNFSEDWNSTLYIDTKTTNAADPAVMRNMRISCIPMVGQNNTDYYYTQAANTYNLTNDFQNTTTLTINQTNADDAWLLIISADAQMMNSTSSNSTQIRTCIGCSNCSYVAMLSEQIEDIHYDWEDYFFMNYTELATGEHTICLQAKQNASWQSNITNARIVALKAKSHFPQIEHNETYDLKSNSVIQNHTEGDNPMVALNVTSQFATAYPFITFANSIYNHSDNEAGTVIRTDSTEYGDIYSNITGYERDGMSAASDKLIYATFKKHTLYASTEYWFNTTQAPRVGDGTGTSYHIEGEINSMAMATPSYQLNATLNITGINKTKGYNFTFKTSYILTADETTPSILIYNYTAGTWDNTSFSPTKDGIERNFTYSMNGNNVNITGCAQVRYIITEHYGGQTDIAMDFVWIDYELDTTSPEINAISDTPDPQEYGQYVNISANITDEHGVNSAYLNISMPNGTHSNASMTNNGNDYWINSTAYTTVGLYNYTLYTNDTYGNANTSSGNFTIQDTTPPEINWYSPIGGTFNISIDLINSGHIFRSNSNYSLIFINGTGSLFQAYTTFIKVGQSLELGTYYGFRAFLTFDTSEYRPNGIENLKIGLTLGGTTYPTFNVTAYDVNIGTLDAGDWDIETYNAWTLFDTADMPTPLIPYEWALINISSERINSTSNVTQISLRTDKEGIPPTGNSEIAVVETSIGMEPCLIFDYTPTYEYNEYVNISANITDHSAMTAYLNVTYPDNSTTNVSMSNSGDIYYTNATYGQIGNHSWTIWATDIYGNTNSTSGNFTIQDTTSPEINAISDTPDPQEYGQYVNISANITDEHGVNSAYLNISMPNGTHSNASMTNNGNDYWTNSTAYTTVGLYNYTLYTNDTYGNANTSSGNFTITSTPTTVPDGDINMVLRSVNFTIKKNGNRYIFKYEPNDGIRAREIRWSFGDGRGDRGETAIYEYSGNGIFNVTMEVITEKHGHISATRELRVGEPTELAKNTIEIWGITISSIGLLTSGIVGLIIIAFRMAYPPLEKKVLGRIIDIRASLTLSLCGICVGLYLGGYLDAAITYIRGLFGT